MDKETVLRVAKVARIDLKENEVEQFAADLEDVLSSFNVLDEAPEVKEFDLGPIKVEDILRDDVVHVDIDPAILRKCMRTKEDWVRGPRLS